MTRIISGGAKGRTLKVPSQGTRPTSDRVREALFSQLESIFGLVGGAAWEGIAVLDLYAGSGALGLEAASRGAGPVVMVDNAKDAVRAIRANVAALGMGGRARSGPRPGGPDGGPPRPVSPGAPATRDASRAPARAPEVVSGRVEQVASRGLPASAGGPFDLVFLDPPYAVDSAALDRVLEDLGRPGGLAAQDGIVVVERSTRDTPPTWPAGWEHLGSRAYGETSVHLARVSSAE
jgi:16S rRNA (guanine966-N2)-methyltransferase